MSPLKSLLDIIFPKFCLNCQKEGEFLCEDCQSLIEISEYQFCPFCKYPNRVIKFGKCEKHLSKKLDTLFSALPYQDKLVKKIIFKFKYPPFLKDLGKILANFVIAHFKLLEKEEIFKEKEAIFLGVPSGKKKERWRGFNQAEIIAENLAQYYQLQFKKGVIKKIKETKPQAELKLPEREKNLKNCFRLIEKEAIFKKRVFLVDDVFTTGTTLEEIAKILKRGGVKEVIGIVVAREFLK